jgi:hypothetical protein
MAIFRMTESLDTRMNAHGALTLINDLIEAQMR